MVADRTAVVTGGGRGIGQAICIELAASGADVVVADIDESAMEETKQLVEDEGQRAVTIKTDLQQLDDVQQTIDEIFDIFDSVEILVNNAGIAGPTRLCEEVTAEEWDQTIDVNLRGPFYMCRELLPGMKDQSYGRIVNIASVTGKRPLEQRLPYATAKMGLLGFTRTLAAEVGEHNINVNAICPGSVYGPRIKRVFEEKAEATNQTYSDIRKEAENASARNELVSRKDIAQLAAFLCSDNSTRITGQDINVSSGKVMY
ncbi:SDR family NAD(P)-dependent oxidoreductase [Haladaptatus sp. DFWS20]|uniref:SDR family NAD(P)-dependent oxidoreductase n=1 Tax=Haladaptatus sp. DFWS20 TaxID=3403467 RepID=UPI003EC0493D